MTIWLSTLVFKFTLLAGKMSPAYADSEFRYVDPKPIEQLFLARLQRACVDSKLAKAPEVAEYLKMVAMDMVTLYFTPSPEAQVRLKIHLAVLSFLIEQKSSDLTEAQRSMRQIVGMMTEVLPQPMQTILDDLRNPDSVAALATDLERRGLLTYHPRSKLENICVRMGLPWLAVGATVSCVLSFANEPQLLLSPQGAMVALGAVGVVASMGWVTQQLAKWLVRARKVSYSTTVRKISTQEWLKNSECGRALRRESSSTVGDASDTNHALNFGQLGHDLR